MNIYVSCAGYTQLCDWWSVGVILFEMLVGQPPFLAPTPTETQIKVSGLKENILLIYKSPTKCQPGVPGLVQSQQVRSVKLCHILSAYLAVCGQIAGMNVAADFG